MGKMKACAHPTEKKTWHVTMEDIPIETYCVMLHWRDVASLRLVSKRFSQDPELFPSIGVEPHDFGRNLKFCCDVCNTIDTMRHGSGHHCAPCAARLNKTLTKTDALKTGIPHRQLEELNCEFRRNPHGPASIRIYKLADLFGYAPTAYERELKQIQAERRKRIRIEKRTITIKRCFERNEEPWPEQTDPHYEPVERYIKTTIGSAKKTLERYRTMRLKDQVYQVRSKRSRQALDQYDPDHQDKFKGLTFGRYQIETWIQTHDRQYPDVEDLNRLMRSITDLVERHEQLKQALTGRGLELRPDSRLCERYVLQGGDMENVVDIMDEMAWYFGSTDYLHHIRNMRYGYYGSDSDEYEDARISKSESAKEIVLIEKMKQWSNGVEPDLNVPDRVPRTIRKTCQAMWDRELGVRLYVERVKNRDPNLTETDQTITDRHRVLVMNFLKQAHRVDVDAGEPCSVTRDWLRQYELSRLGFGDRWVRSIETQLHQRRR